MLHDSKRSYLNADERPNIHLVDGGLADNLGLRTVLDQTQADGSLRNSVLQMSDTKIQKLIIIAVNAERDPAEHIDTSDLVPTAFSIAGSEVDSLVNAGRRITLESPAFKALVKSFDSQ